MRDRAILPPSARIGTGQTKQPSACCSLTFNADGSFSYQANAGFHGIDSFTYSDTDSTTLTSANATVSLTVNVVDTGPAPLTISDTTTGHAITAPVVGDVLQANLGADPDGGPNTGTQYQWLDNGQIILNATGSTYTVASTDLNHTISVQAHYSDGQGSVDTSNSSATGTVVSGDLPPVIQSFTNGTVFEGDGLDPNVGKQLIVNGGFENFPPTSSWTVTNASVGSGNFGIASPHSGVLALGFGQGSETLSQNVATVADGVYTVDFFLANNLGSTDSFTAMWNGETLGTPIVNAGPSGYNEYTYTVCSTTSP
jgi:hypothetical protein